MKSANLCSADPVFSCDTVNPSGILKTLHRWWDVDLRDQGVAEARRRGQMLKDRASTSTAAVTSVLVRAIPDPRSRAREMDRMWLPVAKDGD